jgi:hypothetical protein
MNGALTLEVRCVFILNTQKLQFVFVKTLYIHGVYSLNLHYILTAHCITQWRLLEISSGGISSLQELNELCAQTSSNKEAMQQACLSASFCTRLFLQKKVL